MSDRRSGKRRRGHGRSGELTYYAPAEPAVTFAPLPPADPMHGYTLNGIAAMARTVVANNLHWWGAGDRNDQYETAWSGIAEYLCSSAEKPSRLELMAAGQTAVGVEVKAQMRHHGARRDGTNNGAGFARYWGWAAFSFPSPEIGVIERTAVAQILAALTPRQREAVTTLAATGDYILAAQALGIEPETFISLIGRSRTRFLALWHEGETPSRRWHQTRVWRRETTDPAELAERARYAAKRRNERAARKVALAVCDSCWDEWRAWLRYRPVWPVEFITIGMSNPRNIAEQQQARAQAGWRDVIRSQQALIVRLCRENHCTATEEAA